MKNGIFELVKLILTSPSLEGTEGVELRPVLTARGKGIEVSQNPRLPVDYNLDYDKKIFDFIVFDLAPFIGMMSSAPEAVLGIFELLNAQTLILRLSVGDVLDSDFIDYLLEIGFRAPRPEWDRCRGEFAYVGVAFSYIKVVQ